MPTTADLISITPLTLSETFNSWYNKTNYIISNLNPLQVYDTFSGSGLTRADGTSGGFYNGVITLSVFAGRGLSFGPGGDLIVDFDGLTTISRPDNADEFMIRDVSDTTDGAGGTLKRVTASNVLAPHINNNIEFGGNITILGSLVVGGSDANIRTASLAISDEQILLADQEKATFTIYDSGGRLTAASFVVGATAHYSDITGNATGASAEAIAPIVSWTYSSGTTGTLVVGGRFSRGSVDDFQTNGYLTSVTGPSSGSQFQLTGSISITDAFLADFQYIDDPGFVVKGASGDKSFTWDRTQNAFLSNVGLGVTGNQSIRSSKFTSNDLTRYGSRANSFDFEGATDGNTTFYVSETNKGAWRIRKKAQNSATAANVLEFSYDISGSSAGTFPTQQFALQATAFGQTFSGITTTSWGEGLNVDQLDGAHGQLTASAYAIPIATSTGKISSDWVAADAIRKTHTQTNHGFTLGTVIRYDIATSGYTAAKANSTKNAETVGMVSSVPDANTFEVTQKGWIAGLTGLSAGYPYYLSATTAGTISPYIPDYSSSEARIEKAMLLGLSLTQGLVLNYVGSVINEATDLVYIQGLVPLGAIYPYAGNESDLSDEWLICNGKAYSTTTYSDLNDLLGNKYYLETELLYVSSVTGYFTLYNADTLNLEAGDTLEISWDGGSRTGVNIDNIVTSPDVTITFDQGSGTALPTVGTRIRVKPDANSGKFFVPDLQERFIIGQSATGFTAFADAQVGGTAWSDLATADLPSHYHNIPMESTNVASGGGSVTIRHLPNDYSSGDGLFNVGVSGATGGGETFSNLPPYLVTKFIIRAKKGAPALVLTGHNHDNRYIRFSSTGQSLTSGDLNVFRTNAKVSGIALGDSFGASGNTHDHDLRYLTLTGGTMSGVLNMGGYKVTNVDTCTQPTDAANKAYVDANISSGAQGPPGPQGAQGPPGAQGAQGAQGPAGPLSIPFAAGVWKSSVSNLSSTSTTLSNVLTSGTYVFIISCVFTGTINANMTITVGSSSVIVPVQTNTNNVTVSGTISLFTSESSLALSVSSGLFGSSDTHSYTFIKVA